MATITGATSIDWSTVSLGQVDFAAQIVQASIRGHQLEAQFNSRQWSFISASPTEFVVKLNSGGRLAIGGSGFDTSNPLITSVRFFNPATGEIYRQTGLFSGPGNPSVRSITYGTTSISESFIGNVTIFRNDPNDPNDNTYGGSVRSLTARIGAATVTLRGFFPVTGDDVSANLSGTVTSIAVASGTNTIKMTGLAIDIDVIEAAFAANTLSSVDDLFSFVEDHLTGSDLITYRNTSGAGMSFFGGAGNDTISITGLNGDTLNGGEGNDSLGGGLGEDIVTGGAGNDQIVMLVTAGNVDTIDAGADTDTLVLSGAVPGNHEVVVDLSSLIDQVVSIGGPLDSLAQTDFENFNAAGIGSFVHVTGSASANIIVGSKGGDTIDGADGNDILAGGVGDDTLIGGLGDDAMDGGAGDDILIGGTGQDSVDGGLGNDQVTMAVSAGNVDIADGGAGSDTLVLVGTVSGDGAVTVDLSSVADQVIHIGTADPEVLVQKNFEHLDATGLGGSVHVTGNARANVFTGTGTHDTLMGKAGNDVLKGGEGSDTLVGEEGNDRLEGGDGNDILNGGLGNDTMIGGAGDDDYVIGQGSDVLLEQLDGGIDFVNSSITHTLGANFEFLLLSGTRAINGTGNELDNTLTGNSAANMLRGREGNDTFFGGAGNDRLDGGVGDDTYHVTLGDGRDLIEDSAGTADQLEFNTGIGAADLVISQQANNLRIAITQSTDSVTIRNWYTNSNNQIETIHSGDGQVLLSSQVDQLIQAMASFTAQNGGLTWEQVAAGGGTADQQTQYQNIIAAAWQ